MSRISSNKVPTIKSNSKVNKKVNKGNNSLKSTHKSFEELLLFMFIVSQFKNRHFKSYGLFDDTNLNKAILFKFLLSVYTFPRRTKTRLKFFSGLSLPIITRSQEYLLAANLIQRYPIKRPANFKGVRVFKDDHVLMVTAQGKQFVIDVLAIMVKKGTKPVADKQINDFDNDLIV